VLTFCTGPFTLYTVVKRLGTSTDTDPQSLGYRQGRVAR